MAKLRLPSMYRRGFLRRSPLFLASLLLASCRRPERSAKSSTEASARAVASSTAKASGPSEVAIASGDLPLTPACGVERDGQQEQLTPSQTAGPFYSPNSPQRQSLLEADTQGVRLVLTGRVLAPDCGAIANCLVDFWQTDAQGNYDNQGYRLRGHQFTDSEGRYRLETVVPGIYPGRTRHVHVRVQPVNGSILTTQLYFPQEPLNQRDGFFQQELLATAQNSEAGQQAQFNFVVEAQPQASA